MQPYSVYYLHFESDREDFHNWNNCQDYVCCVMAETQNEAIEITRYVALDQKRAKHIKILGIGHCKEEWTNYEQPMRTNEMEMREELDAMFERIYAKS